MMAFTRVFPRSAFRCLSHSQSQADVGSSVRHFSRSAGSNDSYKLVVVGGGAGGCSTASNFCRLLGKGRVAVIEPSEVRKVQSFLCMHFCSFNFTVSIVLKKKKYCMTSLAGHYI